MKLSKEKIAALKKYQYHAITFICISLCIYEVSHTILIYFSGETGTRITLTPSSEVNFPEVQVCSQNPYNILALNANGIKSLGEYLSAGKWIPNSTEISPEELYNQVVTDMKKRVKYIKFYFKIPIKGVNKIEYKDLSDYCTIEKKIEHVKIWKNSGKCLSYILPKCLVQARIIKIVFGISDDFFVMLHHENEGMKFSSSERIFVQAGKFVRVHIEHQVNVHIDNCEQDFDLDGYVYEKIYQSMMKNLHCTVPWLLNQSNICTESELASKAMKLHEKELLQDLGPKNCRSTKIYMNNPATSDYR